MSWVDVINSWSEEFNFNLPKDSDSLLSLEELHLSSEFCDYIPSELSNLKSLKIFSLYTSDEVRAIPNSFRNLKDLEEFKISGADIRTPPLFLRDFKKLKVLRISVQSAPEWIFSLPELKSLDLSYSTFKTLPKTVKGEVFIENLDLFYCEELKNFPEFELPHLKSLNIIGTGIKKIPDSILKSTQLEYFYNTLYELPESLLKLKNLKSAGTDSEVAKKIRERWKLYDNPKPKWTVALYDWAEEFSINLPDGFSELMEKWNLDIKTATYIPEEIKYLQSIKSLTVWVKLSTIPTGFHHLKELKGLKKLYLEKEKSYFKVPKEVGELKIKELNLKGVSYIPTAVFRIKTLKALYISDSRIKSLPKDIGQLRNLKTLYLYDLKFLTHLPKEIGNLKNLENLSLKYLQSLRSIPPTIGGLSSLKTLYIENCNSLHIFPVTLFQLEQLTEIEVENTPLKYLSKYVGSLSSIRTLEIKGISFKTIPKEIGDLTTLHKLTINGEFLPKEIGNLKWLRELKASVDRELPKEVGNLSKLKELDLSESKFKSLPKELGKLNRLKSLNLNLCRTGIFPNSKELSGLKELQSLVVDSEEAIELLPITITSLPKLYIFDVKDNSPIPESYLNTTAHWFPDDYRVLNRKHQDYNGEELWVLKLIDWLVDHCYCNESKFPKNKRELLNIEELNCTCNIEHFVLTKLPKELSRLKNLKYLNVISGRIEEIPEEFSQLKNLKKLDINTSYLKKFPDSFAHYFKDKF